VEQASPTSPQNRNTVQESCLATRLSQTPISFCDRDKSVAESGQSSYFLSYVPSWIQSQSKSSQSFKALRLGSTTFVGCLNRHRHYRAQKWRWKLLQENTTIYGLGSRSSLLDRYKLSSPSPTWPRLSWWLLSTSGPSRHLGGFWSHSSGRLASRSSMHVGSSLFHHTYHHHTQPPWH